jgi:hypothetical protein
MADESQKAKKAKQQDGVLAGLPATRPSRMGRRARAGGPSVEAARAAASQMADTREATGSSGSGKRTTAADSTRSAKPAPKPATKRSTAKTPAKATGAAATKPAAKTPAKPAAKTPAKPAPPKVATLAEAPKPPRKPRAVRVGSPALKEPTEKAESRRDDVPVARPAQSGTELVTTVVQAAGELASIGLTVGGQILKRAADRLPRP